MVNRLVFQTSGPHLELRYRAGALTSTGQFLNRISIVQEIFAEFTKLMKMYKIDGKFLHFIILGTGLLTRRR